jgi:tRNA threonylcarbamoyladenosine biosynthesis protein TsaB
MPSAAESSPAQPRLLLLDTSGRPGFVALAEGEALLAERQLDDSRRHARDLVPTIAELLQVPNWKAQDLEGVIVTRGPGSYTGLRVGLMAAKTLAYATSCVLIAVDTFTVLAQQAPSSISRVDVLADAQQDKVYQQSFRRQGQNWQPVNELGILPFADWLRRREPEASVTGPGLVKWEGHLPVEVPRLDSSLWVPRARGLLEVGLPRYRAGEHDDLWALEPLYCRPSAAEERWEQRQARRSEAGG